MKKIKRNFKEYNKLDFLKDVANPNDMSIYYNEEDIKENGVVGIEIELFND